MMNDEIDIVKKEFETTVEYSKIVVPKGMRSTYWKYFGFPADDNNDIVTRNKILCVLCNSAIVYNKNTTNLRTHLVAKHPDEFIAIAQEKRRDAFQLEIGTLNSTTPNKKLKLENENESNQGTELKTVESFNDEKISSDIISEFTSELDTQDQRYGEDDSVQNYEYESITEEQNLVQINNIVQPYNVNNLIEKMIITDLISPCILKGVGFQNLIKYMGGEFDASKIKNNIDIFYQEYFDKKTDFFEQKVFLRPYSICIEFFSNYSHEKISTYINIYFAYLDTEKFSLDSIFYKSVPYQELTDIEEVLYGVDMKNCVAFVVNQTDEHLEDFIHVNAPNAKILICFDTILQNCVRYIFNIQDVQEVYEEALKIYEKVILDSESETYTGLDDIFIWNKLIFLQRFVDSVSIDNEKSNIMQKIYEIINCLNPLKITLETIADENISSCTLIQPLISKLIGFNYSIQDCDSEMIKEVKLNVSRILNDAIIKNMFLTEAAYLDPRFQHFVDPKSITIVKKNILSKYNAEAEIRKATTSQLTSELSQGNKSVSENLKCSRKSSLKMFFNQKEDKSKATQIIHKNILEMELIKYESEEVDLDQCPVRWWITNQNNLKILSKISQNYFAIPCTVNSLFKKSMAERLDVYDRRRKLSYKYLNQLWFLHMNSFEIDI